MYVLFKANNNSYKHLRYEQKQTKDESLNDKQCHLNNLRKFLKHYLISWNILLTKVTAV